MGLISRVSSRTYRDNMTDSLQTFRKRGNQAYKEGKFEESIKLYDQAISAKHSGTKQIEISTLYSNKAMAYFHLKNYDLSLEQISQSLKHNKLNIKAWFYKGQSHFELNQYQNSVKALKQAAKIAHD